MSHLQNPPPSRSSAYSRRVWIAGIILLVAAGATLLASLLARNTHGQNTSSAHIPFTVNTANSNGVIHFADGQQNGGQSNRAIILINGLPSLRTGYQYDAWLVNNQNKQAIGLGALSRQAQSYTLDYSGNTNLLDAGNAVEITLEHGGATTPTGKILLSDSFPSQAFQHIRHLLVSFPTTPGKAGLLVGLRSQAEQLLAAAQTLQRLASSQSTGGLTCAAQAVLNITEGQHGTHYHALAQTCSQYNLAHGDGFGLLGNGYIATTQAHVTLASIAPDATTDIRVHSRHVGIALQDMQQWVTTINVDAQTLLKNPANAAVAAQLAKLASQNLNGIDINSDGSIDYVPGEAGATIAYTHAQLMATLVLAPAS